MMLMAIMLIRLQLVGRPLVDDALLVNYLTNRYEVCWTHLHFRPRLFKHLRRI